VAISVGHAVDTDEIRVRSQLFQGICGTRFVPVSRRQEFCQPILWVLYFKTAEQPRLKFEDWGVCRIPFE